MIDQVVAGGRELGLSATPENLRASHMVGLRGTGLDGSLAEKLASEGVYVSVRDNAIRVAPHVYNEPRDIDRLFTALLKASVTPDSRGVRGPASTDQQAPR